ncbi:MAG: glycine--tRNA ligase subunit beta [Proteobacteria bacterium]|nr:glycine--tRNA ligase subunit beta [Pseudomonadota bacterium]
MTHPNLLVELFVEELPPKALSALGMSFCRTLTDSLQAQGLAEIGAGATPYSSPRRLAALVHGVLPKAPGKILTQKLMPASVGMDTLGKPTPALLKKLATLGLADDAMTRVQREGTGKAETLFIEISTPGVALAEGLQKALLEAIARLPIPKMMSYQLADGWTTVKFVRPAHGLVALYGTHVVPVQALGLHAGRETRGHRFEAAVDPIVLADADSYATQLRQQGAVIASFAERRDEIARQLCACAQAAGDGLRPIEDAALLDEVAALVERPNVVVCQFQREFLEVPQECLILTMKANQKYFPLLDGGGKLTHRFLVVSNISPADASAVIQGNERVVRPRLADAKFFYDQDRKKRLADRAEALGTVVYHAKLGSQGQRVERVRAIARGIASLLRWPAEHSALADRAAFLAKADLLTDMVGEFPELQGIMGRYYALHDNEPPLVAQAIEDHYKPRFAGDDLPRSDVGLCVALADKLETLAGLFGIGEKPSGDKDPFALRRHALGVIRMLTEGGTGFSDLPLPAIVSVAVQTFQGMPGYADLTSDIVDFVYERYAQALKDRGCTTQDVDSVLSLRVPRLLDIQTRIEAVRAFWSLPEASELASANKRVANILKKASNVESLEAKRQHMSEPAEIALADALDDIAPKAEAAYRRGDYKQALLILAGLKAPIDAFFEHVMVNVEDETTRNNRLALLMQLRGAMNHVADIARLVS